MVSLDQSVFMVVIISTNNSFKKVYVNIGKLNMTVVTSYNKWFN